MDGEHLHSTGAESTHHGIDVQPERTNTDTAGLPDSGKGNAKTTLGAGSAGSQRNNNVRVSVQGRPDSMHDV